MKTAKIIEQIKENNEDFEWYPSTSEMLECVKTSIKNQFREYNTDKPYTLLDCGAGNGSALNYLDAYESYAIEKSSILINQLDKDVLIIGTDFNESTLIDKKVDVIFSNPPYSEYEKWATKIIIEANAQHIYLIIPNRWVNSSKIKEAMIIRKMDSNVIGEFDFLTADRAARAKVDVIHIRSKKSKRFDVAMETDPFNAWFDANFKPEEISEKKESTANKIKNEMVAGGGLVNVLVDLYNKELSELAANFKAVSMLSPKILNELNVNTDNIKDALKQRLVGLKNLYWKELFKNYHVVNSKLTEESLQTMLRKLNGQTSVDFTTSNIYAITGWVIKNANSYYDSQLIECVEAMVSDANIANYKSNHRLFKKEDWRYGAIYELKKTLVDYALELRCIIENQGGISNSGYSFEQCNGLALRATATINDIVVIANNLGFKCDERVETKENWATLNNQNFVCNDGAVLMNVKAFKNGNLHIKFNQKFIQKLNVEFGRLKGWLKDKEQAADELNINIEDVEFGVNIKLGKSDLLMLN